MEIEILGKTMSFKIEHRIGISAPVDRSYEIAADIGAWPSWSPIHKAASATLAFGGPILLDEHYEGLGRWEQVGTIADWTPLSHIHVSVPKPFYAGRLTRYFEFENLSDTGSLFTVGALFEGLISEWEGRRYAGPLKRGFAAMAEALKLRAEASS